MSLDARNSSHLGDFVYVAAEGQRLLASLCPGRSRAASTQARNRFMWLLAITETAELQAVAAQLRKSLGGAGQVQVKRWLAAVGCIIKVCHELRVEIGPRLRRALLVAVSVCIEALGREDAFRDDVLHTTLGYLIGALPVGADCIVTEIQAASHSVVHVTDSRAVAMIVRQILEDQQGLRELLDQQRLRRSCYEPGELTTALLQLQDRKNTLNNSVVVPVTTRSERPAPVPAATEHTGKVRSLPKRDREEPHSLQGSASKRRVPSAPVAVKSEATPVPRSAGTANAQAAPAPQTTPQPPKAMDSQSAHTPPPVAAAIAKASGRYGSTLEAVPCDMSFTSPGEPSQKDGRIIDVLPDSERPQPGTNSDIVGVTAVTMSSPDATKAGTTSAPKVSKKFSSTGFRT
jgi:hypothetical protein